MKKNSFKSLMIGAALCAMVGPGFAYTTSTSNTGTTVVTSPSQYQTNPADYPHQNMGSLAAPVDADAPIATTTTTIGTTSGSAPLNTVAGNSGMSSSPSYGSSGAISNPQQIGQCLCMEQSYQSLQGDVSAKQAAYDQAVAQRATLTSQLASERAAASTPDQVNTIRATSEKLIVLQGQINDTYIPQLQAATSQYNGAVGQYKASCAGKVFDATVEAQVQSKLQCHG